MDIKELLVDLAHEIAKYIYSKNPTNKFKILIDDLDLMKKSLQKIEICQTKRSKYIYFYLLTSINIKFLRLQRKHRILFDNEVFPNYSIFNDNRYEQHSWLWKH